MVAPPYWQIQDRVDLPAGLDWLGPGEREHLDALKVQKRRQDWLLGRWTAKQALFLYPPLHQLAVESISDLEVLPAIDGSPRVWRSGAEIPVAVSLSHRAGRAFCCLSKDCDVGCDLEVVEPRSPGFVEDYFTAVERAQIEDAGAAGLAVAANALWSAKESLLKLLRLGLTIDSRKVEVQGGSESLGPEWRGFEVAHPGLERSFAGWWCRRGDWILTVATSERTGPPIRVSTNSR